MVNFKQTVKLSHLEGGLYALMVASTESFLFYYAVKKNVNSLQLALLSSLPLLMGALAQIVVPKIVSEAHLAQSVVWTMLVQIFGVLGILYTVAIDYNFHSLLFFTCIHFIGGLCSTPLWIDWAAKIIPKRNFRKYMAGRSSYTWYLILFFYVTLALLGRYTLWFKLVYIFVIGALARVLSASLQLFIIHGDFSKKIKNSSFDDNLYPIKNSAIKMSDELKKYIWLFIVSTGVFRFAIQVSGPFFVPYMINDLKLSMAHYVILSSIPYFGRALYFNRWGRAGKGHSAFYGVELTMLYISFIPIVWTFSRSYYFLLATEILAGVAWGGFELNQVLMIQNFIHIGQKESSRILLGIHMALTNFFGVLGAVVGAYLLKAQLSFFQVFIISSILRYIISFCLIYKAFRLRKKDFSAKQIWNYLRIILPLS